jgi:hypothetical protein
MDIRDYITSKERLTFPKREKISIKIILGISAITVTYFLLIQAINSIGGV